MTTRQLIALLNEWPLDYEVAVSVPRSSYWWPIEGVGGIAGSAIDGSDSVTTIEIANTSPYFTIVERDDDLNRED